MDPIKILKRAWQILWSYRALWVFGLVLALAGAGATARGSSSNGTQYQYGGNNQQPSPQSMQEFFQNLNREIEKVFHEGIPDTNISGQVLTTILWIVGIFVVLMILVGIVMAVARYVSETAVIRMVDEYEGAGTKMTVRQGFGIGWSRTSWRLFLINLIVNLPAIFLLLMLLVAGVAIYFAVVNGNATFTAATVITMVGLVFLSIFVVVILSIVLGLLRQFFWRVCVLEGASVGESLRQGFAMVRDNWKNVGLMWLVMIGLGIAWMVVSVIAMILTIPVVLVTSLVGLILVAIPALLLVGVFSLFLAGPLAWIAGGLLVLPLFFVIAFSPWVLLGSWQTVYTSTVWTLTYREIKALPAITPPVEVVPAPGD